MFHQGTKPGFVYVVIDGDIELVREAKAKRVLMDQSKTKIAASVDYSQQ